MPGIKFRGESLAEAGESTKRPRQKIPSGSIVIRLFSTVAGYRQRYTSQTPRLAACHGAKSISIPGQSFFKTAPDKIAILLPLDVENGDFIGYSL